MTANQVNQQAQTSGNESESESNPRVEHPPGYQEACVIAANNLRELDIKVMVKRLRLRFVSSGVALALAGLALAVLEIVEINVVGDPTCLGLGIWAGCVFILSGGVSVRIGRSRRASCCSMTSAVLFDYLGLALLGVCLAFGLRDWMCYASVYLHIYYIWQFIHIGKFCSGVLVATFVTALTVSYFKFFNKYRAHRVSTADDPTIATRTVSLFSVLEDLNNCEEDEPKFVEPPPDYSSVVAMDTALASAGSTQQNNSLPHIQLASTVLSTTLNASSSDSVTGQ